MLNHPNPQPPADDDPPKYQPEEGLGEMLKHMLGSRLGTTYTHTVTPAPYIRQKIKLRFWVWYRWYRATLWFRRGPHVKITRGK